ncbi:hypothetical protein [Flavobacterium salmonis]|uniref:Uncharacterized protein n=1 Tax=Flavobacterium salmonis TaxID=2654844 RepID=A0A6V6Z4Q3_9FLAO|nr:hypothetical protein [Flavobacterium salmonis]CAD0006743.1 hypothetical protein FLAT13_03472 [Flavobacterium salmonis]
MENSNTYSSEELTKYPYHARLAQEQNNNDREEANTGDWEDQRDEAGTDPDRYEEEGGNDNSGGAGSSGSAATNS